MFIGNEGHMARSGANMMTGNPGMTLTMLTVGVLLFGAGLAAGYFIWRQR